MLVCTSGLSPAGLAAAKFTDHPQGPVPKSLATIIKSKRLTTLSPFTSPGPGTPTMGIWRVTTIEKSVACTLPFLTIRG